MPAKPTAEAEESYLCGRTKPCLCGRTKPTNTPYLAVMSDMKGGPLKIYHGPFFKSDRRIWGNLSESDEPGGTNLRESWGLKTHLPCHPFFLVCYKFFLRWHWCNPTSTHFPQIVDLPPRPGQCNWEQSAASLLHPSWRCAQAPRLWTIPGGGQNHPTSEVQLSDNHRRVKTSLVWWPIQEIFRMCLIRLILSIMNE